MENKRFIRTSSGDFWELRKDGTYTKPNCATVIVPTLEFDCVVASADDVRDLIKDGDLVQYNNGSVELVKNANFDRKEVYAIYTQNTRFGNFEIKAIHSIDGFWILR